MGSRRHKRVDNDSNTVTLNAHKFGGNPHKRATWFRQMCKSESASVQIRFRKCADWVRRIPFKCTDRIHQMQSASEYCRGRNETVEVTSEIARRLSVAAVVLELERNEMGGVNGEVVTL